MSHGFTPLELAGFTTLLEHMTDKPSPRSLPSQPTEVELQILRVLWDLGPSPVREIHKRLSAEKDTNYSTTVKMLSIMLEKKLVTRDESAQPHVYKPVLTRKKAGQKLLGNLIDKVYEGSAMSLVLQALSQARATPGELAAARKMLDQLENKS